MKPNPECPSPWADNIADLYLNKRRHYRWICNKYKITPAEILEIADAFKLKLLWREGK